MKSALVKGFVVAILHVLLVTTLAAKYYYDRATNPRVWVRASNVDPDLPVRGRYLSLRLVLDAPGVFAEPPLEEAKAGEKSEQSPNCDVNQKPKAKPKRFVRKYDSKQVRIQLGDHKLIALPDEHSEVRARWMRNAEGKSEVSLEEPVAFFIPEHALNPAHTRPGEELWVEVTMPRKGPPRPIRLGVKGKDGVLNSIAAQ